MGRNSQARIEKLVELVARLRGPDGCPWDRAQTVPSLRPYLIEEAHEAAAAIEEGDATALCGELGDLLFQIVLISSLAAEAGDFTLSQVIDTVEAKMVARHPHVFGGERLEDATAVERAWEERKRQSRGQGSLLAGVPSSLPALVAAYRMSQKAAGIGFDWSSPKEVLIKVEEELGELREALDSEPSTPTSASVAEELGDLFFSLANLARHLGVDPEGAAATANRKFRRRFEFVEGRLGIDEGPEASMEKMESLWEEAKRREG